MADVDSVIIRPDARSWTAPERAESAHDFHAGLEGYAPTALAELPALARELGVGRVFLKDESDRLGLPAFKILGASWAVARTLADRFGMPIRGLSIATLREACAASGPLTLVTATDGNHGRAVAHMARELGVAARVYVPRGLTDSARGAILAEGAELVEFDLEYDDVVAVAAASAEGRADELVIQDTAWEGYTEVPGWIVDGYATLFTEADEQLASVGAGGADLVAVPVGVGSLAHAAVDYYRGTSGARPVLLSVEPVTAACVLASLARDETVSVDTSTPTIMKGLNCGTPSVTAWPSLSQGLDAAVAVTDADAHRAVGDLASLGVSSGPCGAATLAGVRRLFENPDHASALGLDASSVVVLINTEGLAANPVEPSEGAER
ncbi:MAG: diaminopropionate ammonia-lyase [Cryobacterium sp.]|nr:diaminopropionate ammonia-lyase [Cryobacterium sp.]